MGAYGAEGARGATGYLLSGRFCFGMGTESVRKGGEKVMRRIILVLGVALIMIAMLAVMALPAFAQGKSQCAKQGASFKPPGGALVPFFCGIGPYR